MHTNPANQKFNELCFNLLVLNHPPLHSSVEKPSLLSPGFIHTFERERGGGGEGGWELRHLWNCPLKPVGLAQLDPDLSLNSSTSWIDKQQRQFVKQVSYVKILLCIWYTHERNILLKFELPYNISLKIKALQKWAGSLLLPCITVQY